MDGDVGVGADIEARYARYAKIERLQHRRRGWAWTAGSGCAAFVVVLVVTGLLAPSSQDTGTGPGYIVLGFIVLLIAGLVLISLAAVVIDTLRLRAIVPHARMRPRMRVPHHPVHAHLYAYPPRHRSSWVIAWIGMLFLFLFGLFMLPGLVDGAAYLAGAEPAVTFIPVSYTPSCGDGSSLHCRTEGFLEASRTDAEWPHRVPLRQPMTVREPLWNWGIGYDLIDGTDTAVGGILAGAMMGGIDVGIVVLAVKLVRRRQRHRRETEDLLTAPWTR